MDMHGINLRRLLQALSGDQQGRSELFAMFPRRIALPAIVWRFTLLVSAVLLLLRMFGPYYNTMRRSDVCHGSRPDSLILRKARSWNTRETRAENVITSAARSPPCTINYTKLVRRLIVNKTAPVSFEHIADANPEVEVGGIWRPSNCSASGGRLAVVIPYRDRDTHLKIFLQHIHPFLQSQLIEYQIVVVEQAKGTFNRGMMRNVGFMEASKMADFRCSIFHDVDLLPMDQRNLYSCPNLPRHLCVAMDKFDFKPLADRKGNVLLTMKGEDGTYFVTGGALFGGAVLFDNNDFRAVNGYSNLFFGWGGEDDDLMNRLTKYGLPVDRPLPDVGCYVTLDHMKSQPNPLRWALFQSGKNRTERDGLTSLKYTLLSHTMYPTHTHIVVDINMSWYEDSIKKENKQFVNGPPPVQQSWPYPSSPSKQPRRPHSNGKP